MSSSPEELNRLRMWIQWVGALGALNLLAGVGLGAGVVITAAYAGIAIPYEIASKIHLEEITVHTAEAGDTPIDIGESLASELMRGRLGSVCNLGAAVAAVHGLVGIGLLVCA